MAELPKHLSGQKRRVPTTNERPPVMNNERPSAMNNQSGRQSSLFRRSVSLNSDQRPPTLSRQSSFDGVQQLYNPPGRQSSLERRSASSSSDQRPLMPPLMSQSSLEEFEEEEWEDLRRRCAAIVAMYASYVTTLLLASRFSRVERQIPVTRNYERHALMTRLTTMSDEDCHSQLRMGREAFRRLVHLLRDTRRLRDTWYTNVEEKLAKFLYLIGQNARNRNVKFMFFRSGETVSRHFHQVLSAIISLHEIFLRQPDGVECPQEIMNSSKFFPYFKDCIGALDGSHFRVKVSNDVVKRYRGRKDFPTQNVLAACSFDLKFTYVLPGWEGSASDSRILNNALTRELDRLILPEGKYYLVDAGYQLKVGFLTSYRSTRYHLKEYTSLGPQNSRELFNLRHASLRNGIERAFGVLKKRFPILGSGTEPYYPVDIQADIVLAGCILHNYLMGVDPNERLIAEVDAELNDVEVTNEAQEPRSGRAQDCREGEILRERIATAMWSEYLEE